MSDDESDQGAAGMPQYKRPDQKTLEDIMSTDKEDESLENYKKKLVGDNAIGLVLFPDDPRVVLVQKLGLAVPDREEITMDLKDTSNLPKQKFVLKEGCSYRIKIYFFVQKEIVTGLQYQHKVHRKGIKVASHKFMAGSYGPKKELQCFTSPVEEAPSGMMSRGTYTMKSKFIDDDQNEYLKWEWQLEIKKDWA